MWTNWKSEKTFLATVQLPMDSAGIAFVMAERLCDVCQSDVSGCFTVPRVLGW